MTIPVRSIRLQKRSSQSLDTLSGASGEIFFDADQNTLRIYTANQADSIVLADRIWTQENTFSGDFQDLTNKPVIPTDIRDLSDIENRLFSGDYNDLDNAPDLDSLNVDISTIDSIGDVDTSTNAPTNGQLLQYDGTNWVNTTVAGFENTDTTYSIAPASNVGGADIVLTDSDSGTSTVNLVEGTNVTIDVNLSNEIEISASSGAINDLSDTAITTPADGQLLGYSNGQWINVSPAQASGIELTDLSVTSNAAGTAALSYDSNTGVFTYTPPDLSGFSALDDFSVTTSTASGGGSLSYNNTTGAFTFRPAAVSTLIELGDLSVTTNAASGGGALSYDNTTGVFTFTPSAGGDLVNDTTPQLGGDLDLNSNNITGVGDIVINTDKFTVAATTGNTVVAGTLDVGGTVSADSFSSSATGAPAITSASTITLDAPDGTIVQSGPFRLPSLTTTERNALTAVNGDMIYNSTDNKAQVYENGAWVNLV